MTEISYPSVLIGISICWIFMRMAFCIAARRVSIRREAQLLLVYFCLIVIARFTFFPFGTVNGSIRPLLFDPARMFPPRINLIPFVYLFDYPTRSEALLNLIGNTAMFLPVGIIWPTVFRALNTPSRVIAAGAGFTLAIELLQLPFFDRVTDIDDLILNLTGYMLGWCIVMLVRACRKKASE